jgi:hypothetical protein
VEKQYSEVTNKNSKIYRNRVYNYGIAQPMYEQLGSLLQIYRINYYENAEFLFKYTGMTKKQYAKRVESMGIKSCIALHYKIKNNLLLGFDLIYVAALANVFKLPTSLLINHSLREIEDFVPEEYGLQRNMYSGSRKKLSHIDYVAAKSNTKSVFKRITKQKAYKKANNPPGIVNLLKYLESGI